MTSHTATTKFPMMVTFLVSLFLFSATTPSSCFASDPAKAFINELGNDVIRILANRNERMSLRKEQFRKEIREHFDLPTIGKFIINRYWRRMTPDQRKAYLRLFEDAVIENYASQFDDYNNEKLIITKSRQTRDGGTVVASSVSRSSAAEPLIIKWKVFNTKRGLKVLDVIVNNISMSITLRNEYVSAINERGGINGLLGYLREKISADRRKQSNSSDLTSAAGPTSFGNFL